MNIYFPNFQHSASTSSQEAIASLCCLTKCNTRMHWPDKIGAPCWNHAVRNTHFIFILGDRGGSLDSYAESATHIKLKIGTIHGDGQIVLCKLYAAHFMMLKILVNHLDSFSGWISCSIWIVWSSLFGIIKKKQKLSITNVCRPTEFHS